MIDCDKVKGFISDYIEKQLSPGLTTEMDHHFQQCTDCRMILNRVPKVQSLMTNLAAVKCAEDFNLKLRERIAGSQNESLLSSDSFKKVSYGFSFAVFILAIVFGFNVFDQTETNSGVVLPQVQKQEATAPSNAATQNIHQVSNNLTQTEEMDVRTKDSEGSFVDSAKTNAEDDVKDPRVKYVDTK